jgi:hypothetical protein
MIGVVPVVELGLVPGGYAHTDEQDIGRCLLRNSAEGQNQFILVAHKILKVRTNALCPGGGIAQDLR